MRTAASPPHSTPSPASPKRSTPRSTYLVIEGVPRRPLHLEDHGLAERLAGLAELDEEDRTSLLRILDALLTKKRVRALAGEAT